MKRTAAASAVVVVSAVAISGCSSGGSGSKGHTDAKADSQLSLLYAAMNANDIATLRKLACNSKPLAGSAGDMSAITDVRAKTNASVVGNTATALGQFEFVIGQRTLPATFIATLKRRGSAWCVQSLQEASQVASSTSASSR